MNDELKIHEQIVYQSKSGKNVWIVGFACILIGCFLDWSIIVNFKLLNSTAYFLLVFFSLFMIGGIIVLVQFRRITITDSRIIIASPFLFKFKIFAFENLKTKKESDYSINTSGSFGSKTPIHEGKKIEMNFGNDEELRFDSFETKDYYEIIKAINSVTKK